MIIFHNKEMILEIWKEFALLPIQVNTSKQPLLKIEIFTFVMQLVLPYANNVKKKKKKSHFLLWNTLKVLLYDNKIKTVSLITLSPFVEMIPHHLIKIWRLIYSGNTPYSKNYKDDGESIIKSTNLPIILLI